MELYTAVAFITIGIAFVSGTINLLSGLHEHKDKTELVFGILVLCVMFFLLLPPVGYIVHDKAPYSLMIDIKRVFMWSHYALLPVFFECYTGYKKPLVKWLIWALLATSYVAMASATQDSPKPLWLMIVLVMLGLIAYYGIRSALSLFHNNKKTAAIWLLASMIIYTVLYLLGLINQLGNNYFGHMTGSKLFFPFHFNMIAFIILMTVRLRTNLYEKYRLEKLLRLRDSRWDSVVEHMQLLIVELDLDGKIRYLNPFAVTTLAYYEDVESSKKNWFEQFEESNSTGMLSNQKYTASLTDGKLPPRLSARMNSKLGKILNINWTTLLMYDKKGEINGTMNVGVDVTQQENAYKQVQMLKSELDKENLLMKGSKTTSETDEHIIGNSEAIIHAINKARQVATTDAGVLLEGETGVGKELFADFIYKYSYRNNKPIVKMNCAALPADLVESEWFGHEKGSFTGAVQSRIGRFELANEGTIFLDEIGELPLSMQAKLLRVLQNGEFERIGGQKTIKVNVRVIAATNRNLLEEVKAGRFREDLYYRLNVFPIIIPALRHRKEDISLLAANFLIKLNDKHGKDIQNISKADMTRLIDYEWPGNVREMINLLERSIIGNNGPTLRLNWTYAPAVVSVNEEGDEYIHDMQRTHIMKILAACEWKINGVNGAASKLGLHPNTLRSRLKKMNITRSEKNGQKVEGVSIKTTQYKSPFQ